MRYAVFVHPDAGARRVGAARPLRARLDACFRDGADLATGEGYRIERPQGGLITETFAITARRDEGSLCGVFDTNSAGAYFETRPVSLWLPHELFGGDAPEAIELSRNDRNGNYQSFFLARRQASGIGTPRRLATPMTRGALFTQGAGVRGGGAPRLHLQAAQQREAGEDQCNADGGQYDGLLNPWTVLLDTSCAASAQEPDLFQDVMNTPGTMVDLHVDIPPEDWLRARLHASLFQQWRCRHSDLPPIPRLLFGDSGAVWERARAFLVVDALEGVFSMDSREEERGRSGDGWRFGWTPPAEVVSRANLDDHLIQRSLDTLGLKDPGEKERTGHGRTLPEGRGDGVCSIRRWQGDVDDGRTGGQDREDIRIVEVLREMFGEAVPQLAIPLANSVSGHITEREAHALKRLVPWDPGLGRAAVRERAAFVSQLSREYMMPRSRIEVALPAPPDWLTGADLSNWNQACETCFEPLSSATAGGDSQRAATWWLRLIQFGPQAQISFTGGAGRPGERGEPDEVRAVWKPWSMWWKRHFRVALFRSSRQWRWDWASRPHGSVLGTAQLGDFRLGEPGMESVSGPADAWPQSIDL